jgi:ATP synthase F1 delta subunit
MMPLVEKKYITAFCKALEANPQEGIPQAIEEVLTLLKGSPQLGSFCANPLIFTHGKEHLWKKILEKLALPSLLNRFILTVAHHDRLNKLERMLERLLSTLPGKGEGVTATVMTASSLSEKQVAHMEGLIQKIFHLNQPVAVCLKVDESLLGGMTIQVGNYWLDASVKRNLSKLEKVMKG